MSFYKLDKMGDWDKEKNNKTDNPLSPQTSERSRKRVAQWNRNCNFF